MLNLMLGTGSPGSGLAPLLQTGGPRSRAGGAALPVLRDAGGVLTREYNITVTENRAVAQPG